MKRNPFYGLSAVAMLGGCYMVDHALKLQPGHLGKLVTLIGVLQVYEALLLALGIFLVAARRAPRDGVMVLMLETLFLVDGTLLATECVTADAAVGEGLAVALVGLAAAKLMLVRRFVPDILPVGVTAILGAQVALVFGVPIAASRLALAGLLVPVSVYGLWWTTLVLPVAQARVREATRARGASAPSRALVAWTWLPAASVVLHVWAVGWIHDVPFRWAFLAPFLLGLALVARRGQVARQIVLPSLAVLVSLGQAEFLGFALPGPIGASMTPLRLALVGAGGVYAVLGWRYGYRWLAALAALFVVVGSAGGSLASIVHAGAALWRLAGRLVPRGTLGWGLTTIAASFVLLAVGASRSLRPRRPPRRSPGPPAGPRRFRGQAGATAALLAAVVAAGVLLAAVDAHALGGARQRDVLLEGVALAGAAVLLGARAASRASRTESDSANRTAAHLGLFAGAGTGLLCLLGFSVSSSSHAAVYAEHAALRDIRAIQSAQAAYRTVNGGLADAKLECLVQPSSCLHGYPADAVHFLDASQAALGEKRGYRRSFRPGPPPDEIPLRGSATSVRSFAYLAVPVEAGETGVRGFCGDSSGNVCFTVDGTAPPLLADGTCDLEACSRLD
jgi:hypothetical protein